MNKEELIGKLQMVYVGDKNALNELIGYYDGLKEVVEIVQQENQKYKEVIDKVKFAIKTNCIKNDKKYEEICCDGDYLLQILEDKEVE